ncbi:hypothetical protein HDV05_003728, partial [Chytridiales sp. JEL 0842]
GWGCCSKRVTDFDDFLKIPGCSVGRHSTVKPETPAPAPAPTTTQKPTITADGKEVYGKPSAPAAEAPVASKAAEPPAKPEVKEEDLHDPVDAVVEVGTSCKRKGCKHSYEGPASKDAECVFHSGVPIFHEGSKSWSCCPRKVLEFDEFLKIQGCKTGKHRFLDPKSTGQEKVEVRHDWYQTPTTVIISVFAKKADKSKTVIHFTENSLHLDGHFQDGRIFEFKTDLFQPIIPEKSKYMVLGTKVEITLAKANGISWAAVEPRSDVKSWTTFGVGGGGGTVGSKEAIVAQDAPLHLLK